MYVEDGVSITTYSGAIHSQAANHNTVLLVVTVVQQVPVCDDNCEHNVIVGKEWPCAIT